MKPTRKQLEEEIRDWRDWLKNRIDRVDELKAEALAKDAELAALRAENAALRARGPARTAPARMAPIRKAG